MPPQVVWSGEVTILKDENGDTRIEYKKVGEAVASSFRPKGMFEGRAVKGLIERLQGK